MLRLKRSSEKRPSAPKRTNGATFLIKPTRQTKPKRQTHPTTTLARQTSTTTTTLTKRPQALIERADDWIHRQVSQSIPNLTPALATKYESRHVEMVADCLRDNGTDTPWEHQHGTFAHPALPFFLNAPSQEEKFQLEGGSDANHTPKLVNISGLDLLTPPHDNPVKIGYNKHAVIGGRLIWGEQISVHNQTLAIQQCPAPPAVMGTLDLDAPSHPTTASTNSTRKASKADLKLSPEGDGEGNGQYGGEASTAQSEPFILLKQATAITNRDVSKMMVYREEHHAFWPESTPTTKPPKSDADHYNQIIAAKRLKNNISEVTAIWDEGSVDGVDGGEQEGGKVDQVEIDTTTITPLNLSNQFPTPTTQVHQIRADLKKASDEIQAEMFTVQKPMLKHLSGKQQAGYLFSSLGNILKRRFKKNLNYDWKWSDQQVSLETIKMFQ
jgi:hypothetical protein